MKIPVNQIALNPQQPRRRFDKAALTELAGSIREHGLLHAITVEETPYGNYILIDGERRLRAHKILGWTEIEATVRPPMNGNGERERAVLALVANLQHADLSIMEEAHAYEALSKMGLSNNAIAQQVGTYGTRVATRRTLLELDPEIQDLVDEGLLPVDQRAVRALMSVPEEHRIKLATKIARPRLGIKAVQKAAEKLNAALQAEKISGEPAVIFAHRSAGKPVIPKWNALKQLGKLPPWESVVKAADKTCEACPLRPQASAIICKDCPAVSLLANLIEVSHVR